MFDNSARNLKERIFTPLSAPFQRLNPAALTWVALGLGVISAIFLWRQQYNWAFIFWVLNRVFDGLDGTVARLTKKQSDLGGYLDILLDFVVYALIPIGLVFGDPTPIRYQLLAILLGVFYINAASWMYLSAILEKRSLGAGTQREHTTVTMPAGLVGGVETMLFYGAFMLFPSIMNLLLGAMAGLTAVTVAQRLLWAMRHLDD